MSVQGPKMQCYRIIIINVLIKVTVNVIRCRALYRVSGRLQTVRVAKLKRMPMSQMRAGLVGVVAGTEQVVLQMTAEGGDRRGVPNGSG